MRHQTALYKTGKSKPVPVTILRKVPNEHKVLCNLEIRLPNGKTKIVPNHSSTIATLVPKSKISKVWKRVLKANPKAAIAVCYEDLQTEITTLVCTRSLGRLHAAIETSESCEIRLWEKDQNLSEGKPSSDDSHTRYYIGKQNIELPVEPDRYA